MVLYNHYRPQNNNLSITINIFSIHCSVKSIEKEISTDFLRPPRFLELIAVISAAVIRNNIVRARSLQTIIGCAASWDGNSNSRRHPRRFPSGAPIII